MPSEQHSNLDAGQMPPLPSGSLRAEVPRKNTGIRLAFALLMIGVTAPLWFPGLFAIWLAILIFSR